MSKQKQTGELLFYQTNEGDTKVQVRFEDNSVWMTQTAIAELYGTSVQNVIMHLKNIYSDGELESDSTCKEYLQVQSEGGREVRRNIMHYNLEAILSVGYRVRSKRGIQFRNWATSRLKEYLVKGFVLNDDRLKDPAGEDYFDELLEKIRDIRASEKRFYQKVKDIYTLSIDYDSKSDEAQKFFKKVQNKMLYAITGNTAAEIIKGRVDHKKPNMGLKSWKSSKVRKQDIAIAKNYLGKNEISDLNKIVTMYLDYAEEMARRREVMYMKDWEKQLDKFLEFNEREILENAGKVKAKIAEEIAAENYEKFDELRKKREAEKADEELLEEVKKLEQKKGKDN